MAAERLLEGRTALITGGSGIAAATARLFARHGAAVAAVDRSADNLRALARDLPGLHAVHADLTAPGAAAEAVASALAALGRVDVLVNVAGISGRSLGDGPVHDATLEAWDAVMDTNARTTFAMCAAALGGPGGMLARGSGAVVNTASVLAYAPSGHHFATHAYAASKGAILALTRAMAACYAPRGVRVNAVAPGLIATPMSRRAQDDPATLDYIRHKQPLTGTLGRPDDVAGAALYLASPLAAFVTGETIEVAGGWSVAG